MPTVLSNSIFTFSLLVLIDKMDFMSMIIKKMEQVLDYEKPARLTTLRRLQIEEEGNPFKILIGTILSVVQEMKILQRLSLTYLKNSRMCGN